MNNSGQALADMKAKIAATQDRVKTPDADPSTWPLIEKLKGADVPPGFAVFRIGGEGGPVTALPELLDTAPLEMRQRYLARVVANASGRCPLCSAIASITPSPNRQAAWATIPVRVGIQHEGECPAEFGETDRQHFDPRGIDGDASNERGQP